MEYNSSFLQVADNNKKEMALVVNINLKDEVFRLFNIKNCIIISQVGGYYNIILAATNELFKHAIKIEEKDYKKTSVKTPELYAFLYMVYTVKSSVVSSIGNLSESTTKRLNDEFITLIDDHRVRYLVVSFTIPGSNKERRHAVLISKPVDNWGIYIPISKEDLSSTATGYKYFEIPFEEKRRKTIVEKDFPQKYEPLVTGFVEPHRFVSYWILSEKVTLVAILQVDWFKKNVLPIVKQYLHLQ